MADLRRTRRVRARKGDGALMSRTELPQRESERLVYRLIAEGGEMTAREIGERTDISRWELQSCLHRLHHSGYIVPVRRAGRSWVWAVR